MKTTKVSRFHKRFLRFTNHGSATHARHNLEVKLSLMFELYHGQRKHFLRLDRTAGREPDMTIAGRGRVRHKRDNGVGSTKTHQDSSLLPLEPK
jgi:hypothetical protein